MSRLNALHQPRDLIGIHQIDGVISTVAHLPGGVLNGVNFIAATAKGMHDMAADETRCAGDENSFHCNAWEC